MFAPYALEYVIAVLGSDRVVVGSDFPFMPDPPGAILEHMAGLTPDDVERLRRTNALALLGETASVPTPST